MDSFCSAVVSFMIALGTLVSSWYLLIDTNVKVNELGEQMSEMHNTLGDLLDNCDPS